MPGFVDVSGMSDQDVKRMNRMDDDVDHQPRRSARSIAAQVGHSISDVWAAACAAQRVNGEYVKENKYRFDEATGNSTLEKRRNRDIMMEFLANPDQLLTEDVEAGEQCRTFLQSDLTFRAVKGKLSEFDSAVSKCLAVKDRFYTVAQRYELAVVACLPGVAARAQASQDITNRVRFARGGFIGEVGEQVQAQVEVLSAKYSQDYGIFWIRGITDQDQPVFFSFKESFDAGTVLTVKGTVKAHKNEFTQLNRVKVL